MTSFYALESKNFYQITTSFRQKKRMCPKSRLAFLGSKRASSERRAPAFDRNPVLGQRALLFDQQTPLLGQISSKKRSRSVRNNVRNVDGISRIYVRFRRKFVEISSTSRRHFDEIMRARAPAQARAVARERARAPSARAHVRRHRAIYMSATSRLPRLPRHSSPY